MNKEQYWLAELDQHGNPKLIDGAHSTKEGANRAAYLHTRLGLTSTQRMAIAHVILSNVELNKNGVNEEAIETLNSIRQLPSRK